MTVGIQRDTAADLAECGPARAAGGPADRSASLTARPKPGPGLRTVRDGSAIRLSSDHVRGNFSAHVRGNFSAYSPRQPMFRSAWLSARRADQRKRAAIPVRRRCCGPLPFTREPGADTKADLGFRVAGVGFEPT